MNEAQEPFRRTACEQADDWQIAAQPPEQIELAVGNVGKAVVVEIDRRGPVPVVAASVDRPPAGQVAAGRLARGEISGETIAAEFVPVGAVRDVNADVVVFDHIPDETIAVAALE